uniref:Uncharacterized protein n=1 Tax=Molossus molossus TaxID=27622 RepID=A0A7J8BMB2_MOLMO|nr:hypothetical protein HJG59_010133 [Molossus molossus]
MTSRSTHNILHESIRLTLQGPQRLEGNQLLGAGGGGEARRPWEKASCQKRGPCSHQGSPGLHVQFHHLGGCGKAWAPPPRTGLLPAGVRLRCRSSNIPSEVTYSSRRAAHRHSINGRLVPPRYKGAATVTSQRDVAAAVM